MRYEQIELDIVNRLAVLAAANVVVVPMPEVQGDYKRPVGTGMRVSVMYKSSEFEKPISTGSVVQKEIISIDVMLQASKLRGANGLYRLQEAVRRRLIGFRPSNCDRLYAVENGYTDWRENVWTHTFTLACVSMAVEDLDTSEDVLITKIMFDEPLIIGG